MKPQGPSADTYKKLKKELFRGGIVSIFIKVTNLLATFGFTVFVARVLGPESFGIYSFAFGIATLIAVIIKSGMPQLMVREVSKYASNDAYALIRGILRRSHQLLMYSSLIVIVSVVLLYLYLDSAEYGDYFHSILLGALAALPIAYCQVHSGALQGFRRLFAAQVSDKIVRPFLAAVMCIIIYYVWDLTAEAAMATQVIAGLIAAVIATFSLTKVAPPQLLRQYAPAYETKRWASSLVPFALLGGFQLINKQADIIMLGLLATPEEVGIYKVASQGGILLIFALSAVQLVIAPHISRLFIQNDISKLRRILVLGAQAMFMLSLGPGLAFIFGGEFLIQLAFGAEYVNAASPLAILAGLNLLAFIFGFPILALNMCGFERATAIILGSSCLINVLLNFLLIPTFGAIGAAFSTGGTLVVSTALSAIWARKILGFNVTVFQLTK